MTLARDLAGIDVVLEDVRAARGRLLLIEGAAGLGKSTLLVEIARLAAIRRFTIGSARARRQQPDGAGSLIDTALAHAQIARPHRAGEQLLERLTARAPLGLLIDDAHLADRDSLCILASLAEQMGEQALLLAITLRPGRLEGDARELIEGLSALRHALRITLRPLSPDGSAELILQALPHATDEFCAECAELTGGNPRLLSELVTWISVNHLEPVAGTPTNALQPVPHRAIRTFVREQLEELGADAVAVASAVALAERDLTLTEVSRIVDLDPERSLQAVDALLESGMLAAGDPLTFAVPIVAYCLRAETPPALAADLRRGVAELAAASGQGTRVSAHHLMLAPPTGNQRVIDQLVELADHEMQEGNPDDAQMLIRRALAEGTDDRHAQSRLLVRLGHVNLLQGRPSSAVSIAAGVAGLNEDRDRADAFLKLGLAQVVAGSPREACVAFDAASDSVDADDPLHSHAEAKRALAGLLVPEVRDSALARVEALSCSPDAARESWGAEMLLANAWQRLCAGAPHREAVAMTHRALAIHDGDSAALGRYFDTAAAALLALADDFEMTERVLVRAGEAARSAGSLLAEHNLELAQALALLHRGRVRDAAERCVPLVTPDVDGAHFNRVAAAAMLATALHEQALTSQAEIVLENALGWASSQEVPQLFLLEAKSRVCLQQGRLADALSAVHEAAALATSFGIANPAVTAWQLIAALCYARSGDGRRAYELAEEAVAVAEMFGTARAKALTLRIQAGIRGGLVELECLEAAETELESSGVALEQAKVLVAFGSALHRAGHDHAARIRLRRGIELADRLGAQRVSRRGLAALLAAGGRPRRARLTGPEALTAAERRVVELAAAGASNPEIAEALVVTRKTVEWHLHKAFVKLGVNSREDLARAMSMVV